MAEVASHAQVALRNVYYYFKAKDDLIVAISDQRTGGIENLIARLEPISDPCERLEGLVHAWSTIVIIDAFYGCPIGSLCFEIARARGPLSENAAHPFRALLSWCEDQFRKLGAGDASER